MIQSQSLILGRPASVVAISPVEVDSPAEPHALRPENSLAGLRVYSRRRQPFASKIAQLPSRSAKLGRLHTICPYYTMFPLEFPFEALGDAAYGDWVLDPFCGRGTTNFAARLRGLPSIGVDSNPVAAAVASAKLAAPKLNAVLTVAKDALAADPPADIPTGRFWELCYEHSTLIDICKLRSRLLSSCGSDAEVVLRAIILGILHGPRQKGLPTYLSSQMPRTYSTKPAAAVRYWERQLLYQPPQVDVLDAVTRRAQFILAEVPPPTGGVVHFGDSRSIDLTPPSRGHFGWVVTSPPYFGMRTYRPDQWLRNWFVGGPPDVDYSQEGQLTHHLDAFAEQLSLAWRNVSSVCRPGARLIVRFGCIPSCPTKPQDLIVRSLKDSGRHWRLVSVRDGGSAASGKRQAKQFGRTTEDAEQEVDLVAVLEE